MAMRLPPVGSSRPPPRLYSYESCPSTSAILTELKIYTGSIGTGAYSEVYDYFYNDQSCVVKIAVSDQACEMLNKENKMYEMLSNTDFFPKIEKCGKGYLIMEKLGKTLLDISIKRTNLLSHKKYFRQMVQAVQICHEKGICHHDIKSDNFMIAITDPYNMKLLDFGLSHHFNKECGGRPDILKLGICLFELEAGFQPFENMENCLYWGIFKINKDMFWRMMAGKNNGFNPSEEFKVLFEGMANQFTIADVIRSEYYNSCLEDAGASAASPFKKHKKRKSNKRVRVQRTSRRKAKRGSARARRVKTAL